MSINLPNGASGPPPAPSRGVILLMILLALASPLIAAAILWPTYAPVCAIVVALLIAILREVHNLPPRG